MGAPEDSADLNRTWSGAADGPGALECTWTGPTEGAGPVMRTDGTAAEETDGLTCV